MVTLHRVPFALSLRYLRATEAPALDAALTIGVLQGCRLLFPCARDVVVYHVHVLPGPKRNPPGMGPCVQLECCLTLVPHRWAEGDGDHDDTQRAVSRH